MSSLKETGMLLIGVILGCLLGFAISWTVTMIEFRYARHSHKYRYNLAQWQDDRAWRLVRVTVAYFMLVMFMSDSIQEWETLMATKETDDAIWVLCRSILVCMAALLVGLLYVGLPIRRTLHAFNDWEEERRRDTIRRILN